MNKHILYLKASRLAWELFPQEDDDYADCKRRGYVQGYVQARLKH